MFNKFWIRAVLKVAPILLLSAACGKDYFTGDKDSRKSRNQYPSSDLSTVPIEDLANGGGILMLTLPNIESSAGIAFVDVTIRPLRFNGEPMSTPTSMNNDEVAIADHLVDLLNSADSDVQDEVSFRAAMASICGKLRPRAINCTEFEALPTWIMKKKFPYRAGKVLEIPKIPTGNIVVAIHLLDAKSVVKEAGSAHALVKAGVSSKVGVTVYAVKPQTGDVKINIIRPTSFVKGWDMNGDPTSCEAVDNKKMVCDSSFQPGDQFAADCKANGGNATMCGCHNFICSKNIKSKVSGWDLQGKPRSCVPVDQNKLACTMIFTPNDQFALDCKAAGAKATMCGCHEFLCSKNIKDTVSGWDLNGNAASCKPPDPKNLVCTEVFTPNDQFAIDCKASGAKAIMCGCHKFLCTKSLKN